MSVVEETKKPETSLEQILIRSRDLLHRLHLASNNIYAIGVKLSIPEDGRADGGICEDVSELIPQLNNVLDGYDENITKIEHSIRHINEHV